MWGIKISFAATCLILLLLLPLATAQYVDPKDPRYIDGTRYIDPKDPKVNEIDPPVYTDPSDPILYSPLNQINGVKSLQGNIQLYSSDNSVSIIPDYFNSRINFKTSISPGGGSDTNKVGVSIADTSPNFLFSKLSAGSNISLVILNPGANESVQINSTATGGGDVNSSDITWDSNTVLDGRYVKIFGDDYIYDNKYFVEDTGGQRVVFWEEGADPNKWQIEVDGNLGIVGGHINIGTEGGTDDMVEGDINILNNYYGLNLKIREDGSFHDDVNVGDDLNVGDQITSKGMTVLGAVSPYPMFFGQNGVGVKATFGGEWCVFSVTLVGDCSGLKFSTAKSAITVPLADQDRFRVFLSLVSKDSIFWFKPKNKSDFPSVNGADVNVDEKGALWGVQLNPDINTMMQLGNSVDHNGWYQAGTRQSWNVPNFYFQNGDFNNLGAGIRFFGFVDFNKSIDINGSGTFTGDLNITQSLNVKGTADFNSFVHFDKNVHIDQNLTVDGNIMLPSGCLKIADIAICPNTVDANGGLLIYDFQ